MASKSFNKFAFVENLDILGWSILLWADWLIQTFTKNENKNSKSNCCTRMIWYPLLVKINLI